MPWQLTLTFACTRMHFEIAKFPTERGTAWCVCHFNILPFRWLFPSSFWGQIKWKHQRNVCMSHGANSILDTEVRGVRVCVNTTTALTSSLNYLIVKSCGLPVGTNRWWCLYIWWKRVDLIPPRERVWQRDFLHLKILADWTFYID